MASCPKTQTNSRPLRRLGPVANTDTKLLIGGHFKRAEFWHRTGVMVKSCGS